MLAGDRGDRATPERSGELDLVRVAGQRLGRVERVERVERPGYRRHPGERQAHAALVARGGDADECERPSLAVHRLQVRTRKRLLELELEDQLAVIERRH